MRQRRLHKIITWKQQQQKQKEQKEQKEQENEKRIKNERSHSIKTYLQSNQFCSRLLN